jgi:hypothetical protein
MNKTAFTKRLMNVANALDDMGLNKDASVIDEITVKVAGWDKHEDDIKIEEAVQKDILTLRGQKRHFMDVGLWDQEAQNEWQRVTASPGAIKDKIAKYRAVFDRLITEENIPDEPEGQMETGGGDGMQ